MVEFNPFLPEFLADPYPFYHHLRSAEPVHWSPLGFWVLTRYADAAALQRDPRFGKAGFGELRREQLGLSPVQRQCSAALQLLDKWMLFMDPPDHTRLRTLVTKAFTPQIVESLRPRVQSQESELTPNPQSPTPSESLQPSPALQLPAEPSIAVLPFTNMSDDPAQDYFSDGLTEDLITDLSKLSGLFVIARHSVFTYKGKMVKVEEISRELGVGYVLEGSVRKADDRVRITAQLVDATTGHHLWAERYDRPLQAIFALQDELRQKILTALKVKLLPAEQARFQRAPTTNLEAYDYYLRGVECYRRLTPAENAQAQQLFARAMELDPQYAAAYAFLSLTYMAQWSLLWSQDPQVVEQALAAVHRALSLNDTLAGACGVLSWVYVPGTLSPGASASVLIAVKPIATGGSPTPHG